MPFCAASCRSSTFNSINIIIEVHSPTALLLLSTFRRTDRDRSHRALAPAIVGQSAIRREYPTLHLSRVDNHEAYTYTEMMCRTYFIVSFLLLIFSGQAFGGTSHGPDLQVRGSSGSGPGAKSPSPTHSKEKAPAHEGPSVRLFGVNVTPGHKPVLSPHSKQSPNLPYEQSDHSSSSRHAPVVHHPAPLHSHETGKHSGSLGHLVAGLQPHPPQRPANPPRRPGRPKGAKNIPKSVKASEALTARPARTAKGQKWWKTAGGTPSASKSAHGTSDRYERQKRYRERKKLGLVGKPLDEHPTKHHQHPPGGPGSPGAGSHAISKRRLWE